MAHYRIVRNLQEASGVEIYCNEKRIEDVDYVHFIVEYGYIPGERREKVNMRIYRRNGTRHVRTDLRVGDILEVETKRE